MDPQLKVYNDISPIIAKIYTLQSLSTPNQFIKYPKQFIRRFLINLSELEENNDHGWIKCCLKLS